MFLCCQLWDCGLYRVMLPVIGYDHVHQFPKWQMSVVDLHNMNF